VLKTEQVDERLWWEVRMKYTPTDVAALTILDIDSHRDYRSFCSCQFCAGDFAECGPKSTAAQTNICFNYARRISRGLHRRWSGA
jgi:dTDP-4-dehydrorhamnose 3,5-epimerase